MHLDPPGWPGAGEDEVVGERSGGHRPSARPRCRARLERVRCAAYFLGWRLARNMAWRPLRRSFMWVACLAILGNLASFVQQGVMAAAGGRFGPDVPVGWPDRVLIVSFALWLAAMNLLLIRPVTPGHARHSGRRRSARSSSPIASLGVLSRERLVQLPLKGRDPVCVKEARLSQQRWQLAGPQHIDPTNAERSPDQWPIRLDEAQDAAHRNIRLVGQRRPHQPELLVHAVDQLGAVASAHIEQRAPGPQDSASTRNWGRALR